MFAPWGRDRSLPREGSLVRSQAHVGDPLNRRVLAVNLDYAAEATAEIKATVAL